MTAGTEPRTFARDSKSNAQSGWSGYPESIMPNPWASRVVLIAAVIGLTEIAPRSGRAQALEPIIYNLTVPAPDKHIVEVEAIVPAGKRPSIEIMMATWSPGFYRVEDYAKRVQGISARTTDGLELEVEATRKNRWRIQTRGGLKIVVYYRLHCEQSSVTTNYVGDELGVINGAATYITLVEQARRPHEVRLELPPAWKRSVTALDRRPMACPTIIERPITTPWLIRRSLPETLSSMSSRSMAASISWWTSATLVRSTDRRLPRSCGRSWRRLAVSGDFCRSRSIIS